MTQKILKLKRTNVGFNEVSFLARPLRMIDKDEMRFHVTHFLVEEDLSAVSTNGSVLHWVKHVTLKPGYYKVRKLAKTLVEVEFVFEKDQAPHSYPDYKDILTETEKDHGHHVYITIDPDNDGECSAAMAIVIRAMGENCINYEYLRALGDGDWEGKIRSETGCHFSHGNYVAIIMPRRIK